MNFRQLFFFVTTVFIMACKESPEKTNVKEDQTTYQSEKLEEYFETLKDLKKFNGVVLVKKQNAIVHSGIYNIFEDPTNSLHVFNHSQFDIHSISKLMAKAVFVDLEKEHILSRTDYIAKYIPDFPKGDKITLEHLLDNQSGLPRGLKNKPDNLIEKTPDELIDLIKKEEFLFEPGSETGYSNIGYQVLYYIIAKSVVMPFVALLDKKLFKPLQMHSTGAHFYLPKENLKSLVMNHEGEDGDFIVVPNVQSDGKNQAKIYSTVNDLILFIEHVKNEPYAKQLGNKERIGWSGGGDGILSHIEYNLAGDYELCFFSNYDEIPFGDIIKTVEKIMTNQTYTLPKAINRKATTLSDAVLKNYVGRYRMREFNNNVFEFRLEESKLVFYQDGER